MKSEPSAPPGPSTVAVLEDDAEFRDVILVPELRAHGFEAEGFATSAELYRRMLGGGFDLLVLDIGLAGEHGLDVAASLRAVSTIGIVALTGRGDRAEQIAGLDASIDAWLSKPVEIDLLVATLRSVARRLGSALPQPVPMVGERGGWQLEDDGWHIRGPDGRNLALSLAERRVLLRLFGTPGEPVTREELVADLASNAEEFDPHRLDMLVHRLRRKVLDRFGAGLPLRAVRGCGYVLLGAEERNA